MHNFNISHLLVVCYSMKIVLISKQRMINAQSVCHSLKIAHYRVIKTLTWRKGFFFLIIFIYYESNNRCLFTYYSSRLWILWISWLFNFFPFYFGRKYNLDISFVRFTLNGVMSRWFVFASWVVNCERTNKCV